MKEPFFEELNELYQEVILDHSKAPRNFRAMDNATGRAEGNNPLCGDRFTIFVRTEDNRIADISFQGAGCASSKAAASIITESLRGRSLADAQVCFRQCTDLVKTGHGEIKPEKLSAFGGVHHFPMRVKCAVLSWHAMMAALNGTGDTVTTEEKHAAE